MSYSSLSYSPYAASSLSSVSTSAYFSFSVLLPVLVVFFVVLFLLSVSLYSSSRFLFLLSPRLPLLVPLSCPGSTHFLCPSSSCSSTYFSLPSRSYSCSSSSISSLNQLLSFLLPFFSWPSASLPLFLFSSPPPNPPFLFLFPFSSRSSSTLFFLYFFSFLFLEILFVFLLVSAFFDHLPDVILFLLTASSKPSLRFSSTVSFLRGFRIILAGIIGSLIANWTDSSHRLLL